ncbi:MAG: ABC transporter permease subunit [Rhodothermales bacterium]
MISVLQRIGSALLVLIGAGVAVSLALALVPDPTDDAFLQRVTTNLTTFFTFDYWGRKSENFPLLEVLLNRGLLSFTLIGGALLTALSVGVSTGVLSALRPRSRFLRTWSGFLHALSSMPILIIGIAAILIATRLFGIPPFRTFLGSGSPGTTILIYLLPILTLALGDGLLSDITRTLHTETTRILEQNYVRAIRARNVPLRPHLIRGLLPPTLSIVASKTAYLIGGSVVVEYVFGWQGLAFQVLDILTTNGPKDYPFLLAATTLFVGLSVLLNMMSRLALLAANPQLRTAPALR